MLVRGKSAIVVCEGRGEGIWVKVVGKFELCYLMRSWQLEGKTLLG